MLGRWNAVYWVPKKEALQTQFSLGAGERDTQSYEERQVRRSMMGLSSGFYCTGI